MIERVTKQVAPCGLRAACSGIWPYMVPAIATETPGGTSRQSCGPTDGCTAQGTMEYL